MICGIGSDKSNKDCKKPVKVLPVPVGDCTKTELFFSIDFSI